MPLVFGSGAAGPGEVFRIDSDAAAPEAVSRGRAGDDAFLVLLDDEVALGVDGEAARGLFVGHEEGVDVIVAVVLFGRADVAGEPAVAAVGAGGGGGHAEHAEPDEGGAEEDCGK